LIYASWIAFSLTEVVTLVFK